MIGYFKGGFYGDETFCTTFSFFFLATSVLYPYLFVDILL
jgi:hypothetical protein